MDQRVAHLFGLLCKAKGLFYRLHTVRTVSGVRNEGSCRYVERSARARERVIGYYVEILRTFKQIGISSEEYLPVPFSIVAAICYVFGNRVSGRPCVHSPQDAAVVGHGLVGPYDVPCDVHGAYPVDIDVERC